MNPVNTKPYQLPPGAIWLGEFNFVLFMVAA